MKLQSMGFSRQEYWSGLPCPLPGDLPNLGIIPRSPALQADSAPAELPGKPNSFQLEVACWSSDMFLTLGVKDPGFKSWTSPLW